MAKVTLVLFFISSMASFNVVLQFVWNREFFTTFIAFDLRQRVRMNPFHVHMQSPSRPKLLETELAVAFFQLRIMFVHPMHVQIVLIFKRLVTDIANNRRFFRGVDSSGMQVEVLVVFKLFITLVADISLDSFRKHDGFPSSEY